MRHVGRLGAAAMSAWREHPVDVMAFWFAVGWANALLRDPTPSSNVHVIMSALAPLPVWGVMAALLAGLHHIALHHQSRTRIRRAYVLRIAAVWWLMITGVFWFSNSITGTPIYLVMGLMCLFHATWGTDE